jgi:hypothetical protein
MGGLNDHRHQPRSWYAWAEAEFIIESEPVNPFVVHRVWRKFPMTQAHAILWEAGVKLDISEFQGCLQPEEFLDWVIIVEEDLDFKWLFDEQLISLVVHELWGKVAVGGNN